MITQLISSHPNLFGLTLTLLGSAGIVWLVRRPWWNKDL